MLALSTRIAKEEGLSLGAAAKKAAQQMSAMQANWTDIYRDIEPEPEPEPAMSLSDTMQAAESFVALVHSVQASPQTHRPAGRDCARVSGATGPCGPVSRRRAVMAAVVESLPGGKLSPVDDAPGTLTPIDALEQCEFALRLLDTYMPPSKFKQRTMRSLVLWLCSARYLRDRRPSARKHLWSHRAK